MLDLAGPAFKTKRTLDRTEMSIASSPARYSAPVKQSRPAPKDGDSSGHLTGQHWPEQTGWNSLA